MSDPIRVKKSDIDTSGDGAIDNKEWQDWKKENARDVTESTTVQITSDEDPTLVLLERTITGAAVDGEKISDNGETADMLTNEADKLKSQMEALKTQIEDYKKKGAEQSQVEELKQRMQALIDRANALSKKAGKPIMDLTSYNKAAGNEGGRSNSGFKATMTSGGAATPATTADAGTKAAGTGAAPTASVYPPAGWNAQTSSGAQFNSDAYMKSMAAEDNIMSNWDAVNESGKRGKQLLMLFAYFARMAESGDMGAMYQFMKFLTFIISKDKAKQQVEMGKKLIALQQLSRQWTDKLLNQKTNANDPESSNELMKTMQLVKSETDSIATSQKLISQMMEEFAQVVETLTNTTKAALETEGRIKRTVSQMR